MAGEEGSDLFRAVFDSINVGCFVIGRTGEVRAWNRFMESHSGVKEADLIGENLFKAFPELPKQWLDRKIKSVLYLKNATFSSWKQRPYLFRFKHHRPLTDDVDYMHQDCAFVPVRGARGMVEAVCINIFDMTDAYISQNKLDQASETMEALEKLSLRDGLTGLFNRRHLEKELADAMNHSRLSGEPLGFLIIDLDHFKRLNDTFGHLAGDEALRKTGRKLLDVSRHRDIPCRYGGEEFAMIFPGTGLEETKEIAEKVREQIAASPVVYDGTEIPVTASIGVALYDPHRHDKPHDFIKDGDNGLYAAKEGGRNCVRHVLA